MKSAIAFLLVLFLFTGHVEAQPLGQEAGNRARSQGQQGWVQIAVPASSGFLFASATGSDTLWAGGDLFRSTDRGLTWERPGTPFSHANPSFYNSRIGCAVAGPTAYVTRDGGVTWDSAFTGLGEIYGVQMMSTQLIFVFSPGFVSRSTDAGKSWKATDLQPSNINAMSFSDAKNGFLVGDKQSFDPNKPDYAIVYHTTNRGLKWTAINSGVPHALLGVAAIDDTTACAIWAGYVDKTTNGGLTWSEIRLTSPLNYFEGISFHNQTDGIIVGYNGTIYTTSNGGNNWILEATPTSNDLYSATFLDDTTIIVVGDRGTILRTTNLGVSWVQQQSPQQPLGVQPLPNPTSGNTKFVFSLPTSQRVTFAIYSLTGALVHGLMNNNFTPAGHQSISLDCSELPSGTYLYRLDAERYSGSGKFVVAR